MADVHHYTAEEVEHHLEEALALVERLDPPEDLRPHVFSHAIGLLSQKTIVQGAPALLPMGGMLQ